jgi:hypothetical protein
LGSLTTRKPAVGALDKLLNGVSPEQLEVERPDGPNNLLPEDLREIAWEPIMMAVRLFQDEGANAFSGNKRERCASAIKCSTKSKSERLKTFHMRPVKQISSPDELENPAGLGESLSHGGNKQRRLLWSILLAFAVVLPAVVEFTILYRQAFDIPYQDDYAAILAFAREYRQLPGFSAKALEVLTQQTNDYKLAFAHFIVACDLEATGHLNFPFLVMLGNLFLLLIAYLLWRTYRSPSPRSLNQRLVEFLPISLLLFAPFYWETLDWSMAGLQNIPVIFFSLLSIILLVATNPGKSGLGRSLLAGLSAVLAALSSANGFLLAPIGLLILLPRKALSAAALWCACFLLPVAVYLYHYVPHRYSAHVLHSAPLNEKVFYFFALLGCAILHPWVAAFFGVALAAIFALSVRSRFDRMHPVSFYFTLWVLATAALVGGLRGAIASRYSIYSVLVFIYAYFYLVSYLSGRVSGSTLKRFSIAAIACSFLFFAAGIFKGNQRLSERRAIVLAGMAHYRANPELNSPMIDPIVLEYWPEEPEFERIELNSALRDHLLVLSSPQSGP